MVRSLSLFARTVRPARTLFLHQPLGCSQQIFYFTTVPSQRKRVLVVGGVAGGASAAARIRRLDEYCEIVVFDKGPHVSFANCGLPYYVGDVIKDERKLLVATPALFRDRFDISVRTLSEVTAILPDKKAIQVKDYTTGKQYEEHYDALVLSPGAAPIHPPLPGINLPGIFSVRTIPDTHRIRKWIDDHSAKRAVVVGGGFIGLEMAENLAHRGLHVTIVEMGPHLMAPLDKEMAVVLEERIRESGNVDLHLGDGISSFRESTSGNSSIDVLTSNGTEFQADLVILAIGVRPETGLAKASGIELGTRGGIKVDERMRTSVPGIWAVGDAVEVRETVTGIDTMVPLAGPANRQGRVAANDICGRATAFRGVQGTAVCGLFGLTVAMTGCNERALVRAGSKDHSAVYLHPGHHVSYFPNAKKLHLKVLFRHTDGKLLGIQAVGEEGAERRVDVFSMAMQKDATVFDLEEAELCYAPQFGAAKDPINMAGMIAANVVRGDMPLARWHDAFGHSEDGPLPLIIDVRHEDEFQAGALPGAKNIPLEELRSRLSEIPTDTDVVLYCKEGQRAYYATRLLLQHGCHPVNLSGGFTTYEWFKSLERKEQP